MNGLPGAYLWCTLICLINVHVRVFVSITAATPVIMIAADTEALIHLLALSPTRIVSRREQEFKLKGPMQIVSIFIRGNLL